jgi:CubicO group peptidase (beta-lactamase class C family)
MLTYARCAPGLEPVLEVMAGLVGSGAEPGAAVSVVVGGREVLAAGGGTQDAGRTQPWSERTLVQTYSTGKPLAALAALLAVRDGHLTLDDPLTTWWPAYRDHPERPTTLRHVLSHTAGKAVFAPEATTLPAHRADALVDVLARQAPATVPGAELAEHASTYGHLVDGLLAAAGSPSVRDRTLQVARALGVDLWFGVDPTQLDRVADLEPLADDWADAYLAAPFARDALLRPPGLLDPAYLRTEAWRTTSFPAVGLHTDARSLAVVMDDLSRADGVLAGMLGADLHAEMVRPQASGPDAFLRGPATWSLGLRVDGGEPGMGGIGGSSAWWSPAQGYAMAYVTRGLLGHDRADTVATALEQHLPDVVGGVR